MTTDELRDAAVAKLKLTTVGYKNKHWTTPPDGSNWDAALDYLAQIGAVAPPPAGVRLRWAPPAGHANFESISPGAGSGYFNLPLDRDFKLNVGDYQAPDGITVIGGRNVVAIGGRITLTGVAGQPYNVGLVSLPRGSGVHFFEGIRIQPHPTINGGTNLHDGIALRHSLAMPVSSSAKVYFQNMRVGPCSIKLGTSDSQAHADIMQFQSDFPGKVYVDRFTALPDYTVFMLSNFSIGGLEVHRFDSQPTDVNPSYGPHLFIYQGVPSSQPVSFDDTWCIPGPGQTHASSFYPQPLSSLVNAGAPPSGNFVTEAQVGVNYISPGYSY